MPITLPLNFDGQKFATKYSLSQVDFRVEDGMLICPSLPELTGNDLLDCVVDVARSDRVRARQIAAKAYAKTIPNWALWTQAQLQTWWDANLEDSIVDGFSIPVGVKTMLKQINLAILRTAQLLIAIRDQLWPDLPEV